MVPKFALNGELKLLRPACDLSIHNIMWSLGRYHHIRLLKKENPKRDRDVNMVMCMKLLVNTHLDVNLCLRGSCYFVPQPRTDKQDRTLYHT